LFYFPHSFLFSCEWWWWWHGFSRYKINSHPSHWINWPLFSFSDISSFTFQDFSLPGNEMEWSSINLLIFGVWWTTHWPFIFLFLNSLSPLFLRFLNDSFFPFFLFIDYSYKNCSVCSFTLVSINVSSSHSCLSFFFYAFLLFQNWPWSFVRGYIFLSFLC
jgi:hypothetical protein